MSAYTQEENLANACIHICVMAQDMDITKEEFIKAISIVYDEILEHENKEKLVRILREQAIKKVFGE